MLVQEEPWVSSQVISWSFERFPKIFSYVLMLFKFQREIFSYYVANFGYTLQLLLLPLLLLSHFSRVRLCDPIGGSPPGSPVPGILQARTLEWVAISFSNAWNWKVKEKSLSRVQPSATPWTAAHQAPPLMGFSRQEYWSGVPLPSPTLQLSSEKSRYINKNQY